jgi:hypothetical protein
MAADVTTIRCRECGWVRHTPKIDDALAYAVHQARMGCGHYMNVNTLTPGSKSPRGGIGRPLWPLEVAAAQLFSKAREQGRKGLPLVLGDPFGPIIVGVPESAIAKGMHAVAKAGYEIGRREVPRGVAVG